MKKIVFVALATMFFVTKLHAQDTVRVYAGLVGMESVSVKNPKNISDFANLRVGAQYSKALSKKTTANTWVSYDPGTNTVLFKAALKTTLGKNLYVEYGFDPTPGTLIRPFPLSVDGQFEFTSESMPPGAALGGFVSYKNTKIGVYSRNNNPEYHLGQNIGPVMFAGWYSKAYSGVTAQLATKRVYLMATATDRHNQALATAIQPFKSNWKIVHDFGVEKGRVTNNLLGLLYPMKIKTFTDSRFGFGYDFKNKSAGVFWLVGMDR